MVLITDNRKENSSGSDLEPALSTNTLHCSAAVFHTMDQVVAPPLPPKTRSPPSSTSVQHTDSSEHSPSHVVKIRINPTEETPCIRISVNSEMMSRPYFFYNVMSSGQISPSDTLDSGTCSDLDGTPPPKKSTSVTLIQHQRASSLTDSDDNDSCDSGQASPQPLPQKLLRDIRQGVVVRPYVERDLQVNQEVKQLDTDMYYKFHLNEHVSEDNVPKVVEDETFAGYKDLLGDGAATIRSAKGTVRGVKNRVRAGIATFLQINSVAKNYKEKDGGKVVVYTTTMGILRETYQACMKVKQILRTLLVKFEERDVFMSTEYQNEIRERMRCDQILVPQVFVDGQHVGDAETIERLNESGELRRILKPFKSMDACTTCKVCGGYRLLPCQVCNGSKKSVHRNHFTTEFVALKCMNCDEVGLVKCSAC